MSKNTDLGSLVNYIKGQVTGRLNAPAYTSATAFTGTIAGYLGFDTSGNILTSAGAGLTGSGTTNYIPKFTGSTSLGNSNLINDANGNLGLGVTPSAWGNTFKAIDINTTGAIASSGNDVQILSNVFNDGTNFIYKQNQGAGRFRINEGQFIWQNAPLGTAGNAITFTERFRISSDGNVGIGTSVTTNGKLVVSGGVTNSIATIAAQIGTVNAITIGDDGTNAVLGVSNSGTNMVFLRRVSGVYSEAMRITSTGRIGVGQTGPGVALSVAGQSENFQLALTRVTGTAGALIGSPADNVLAFADWSGTERMRLDASGRFGLGTTATSGYAMTVTNVDNTIYGPGSAYRIFARFVNNTTDNRGIGIGYNIEAAATYFSCLYSLGQAAQDANNGLALGVYSTTNANYIVKLYVNPKTVYMDLPSSTAGLTSGQLWRDGSGYVRQI
jgi:hypothetical protein